ncbi:hypothetical protein CYMTET_5549 [Cymbomonas tetramitiformis]|uniref:MIR domain-containing protein n=1 Tax=Cymbomonas tetramitiformis TaxID=36881 RepID=A0AAE0GZ30_9CHLO|nr:hypothetical protein CYMTET_5549 [Cymbomonas tetramitiformis]
METDAFSNSTSSLMTNVDVRIGDEVILSVYEPWLSTEECFGFMCATTDLRSCIVHCLDPELKVPHSLIYSRFFIYPKMQYNSLSDASRSFPNKSEEEILEMLETTAVSTVDADVDDKTSGAFERPINSSKTTSKGKKETLLKLKDRLEKERMANLLELKRGSGDKVFFGDVIQLRHRISGKYLTVQQSSVAVEEKDCMRMELLENGTRASWFRVRPGFKSKALGDPVQYNDPVYFQSVNISQSNVHVASVGLQFQQNADRAPSTVKMHTSPWKAKTLDSPYMKAILEVNACSQPTRFKIIPYASQTAVRSILSDRSSREAQYCQLDQGVVPQEVNPVEKPLDMLCAGSVLQIQHCESGGLLMPFNQRADTDFCKWQLNFEVHDDASKDMGASTFLSNSFWKVEKTSHMWAGGRLVWNQFYRIKHVATRLYLRPGSLHRWAAVRKAFVCGKFSTSGTIKLLHVARFLVDVFNSVEMTDQCMDPVTLWRLRPFERYKEGTDPEGRAAGFGVSSLLYLQNVKTGQFLSTRLLEHGRSTAAQVKHISHEGDAVSMQPVNESDLGNLWIVIHAVHSIKRFLTSIRRATLQTPDTTYDDDQGRWIAAFKGSDLAVVFVQLMPDQIELMEMLLMKLTPHSTNLNVLTRHGTPNVRLQNCLYEQNYVALVVLLLQELFDKKRLPPRIVDANPVPGFKYLCQLAHRMLQMVCQSNRAIKSWLAQHTHMFQLQLGTEMKSAYTLMEIYHGNIKLVREIQAEHVQRFMELMRLHRKPRFVEFLKVCAVCKGQPIPQNQNFIAEFLRANPSVMPLVEISGQSVVLVDQINGTRCNCNAFYGKVDALSIRDTGTMELDELLMLYYLQMLSLYRAIVLGHNFVSTAVLLERSSELGLTYDQMLELMRHDGLPFLLRKNICDLLQVVYLQNYRQEDTPLISQTHIWTPASPAARIPRKSRLSSARVGEDSLDPAKVPVEAEHGFPRMKAFVVKYITENNAFNVSKRGQNMLTGSVIELLDMMLKCGVYSAQPKPPSTVRGHAEDDEAALTQAPQLPQQIVTPRVGSKRTGSAAKAASMPSHDLEQIKPLVEPLLYLLDGSNDCQDNPTFKHCSQDNGAPEEEPMRAGSGQMRGVARRRNGPTVPLGDERYKFDDDSKLMMEAKVRICEVLSSLFAVRLDRRLHMMREAYEELFHAAFSGHVGKFSQIAGGAHKEELGSDEEQVPVLMEGSSSSSELVTALSSRTAWEGGKVGRVWSSNQLTTLKKKLFDTVFLSPMVAHSEKDDSMNPGFLVKLLLDLMRYNYPPLAAGAFNVLHQHLTQRAALVEGSESLQLLVYPEVVQAYSEVCQELAALKRHIKRLVNSTAAAFNTAADRCESILGRFIDLCEEAPCRATWRTRASYKSTVMEVCGLSKSSLAVDDSSAAKFQTILGNAGIFDLVLRILRQPMPRKADEHLDEAQQRLKRLFVTCHQFLTASVSRPLHPKNQQMLWRYVPELLESMGTPGLDVASTIAATVCDNAALAVRVDSRFAKHFLDLIRTHGRQVRWVRFLYRLVLVKGEVIEQNREMVFFQLLSSEYRKHTCLLFNGPGGCARRASLLAALEHEKDPFGSQLLYHVELVNLLSVCALDSNTTVRHIARRLFSLREAIHHILDCARAWTESPATNHLWSDRALDKEDALRLAVPPLRTDVAASTALLVKGAFVRFLTAVYIEVDDAPRMLDAVAWYRVWQLPADLLPGASEGAPADVAVQPLDGPVDGAEAGRMAMVPASTLVESFAEDMRSLVREGGRGKYGEALQEYMAEAVLPCLKALLNGSLPMPMSGVTGAVKASLRDMLEAAVSFGDESVTPHTPTLLGHCEEILWNLGSLSASFDGLPKRRSSTPVDLMSVSTMSGLLILSCREAWAQFKADFALALGVVDRKRVLGRGIWSHAKLLAYGSGHQQAKSFAPAGSFWLPWKTMADNAELQLPAAAAAAGPDPPRGRRSRSRDPRKSLGLRKSVLVNIGAIGGLTWSRSDAHVLKEDASTVQGEVDTVRFIVTMLEQSSDTANPEKLQTAALRVLRCGLYAEEVPSWSHVSEEHSTANFQRFIAGQRPMKVASSSTSEAKKLMWVQTRYARAGVARLASMYICSPSEEVSTAARRLLISLLEGGNSAVLDIMYQELTRADKISMQRSMRFFRYLGEALRAIPRTVQGFQQAVHQLLPKAHAELSQVEVRRKSRRVSVIAEKSRVGQSAGLEMDTHVRSVKNACELLRMVQLFVEGHHLNMQNLLRSQPHTRTSVDVVSELVELVEFLQPHLQDGLATGARHLSLLMLQCLQTLTELVQGPCIANVVLLTGSNLVKVVDTLLGTLNLRQMMTEGGPDRSSAELPFFRCSIEMDLWAANITSPALCLCTPPLRSPSRPSPCRAHPHPFPPAHPLLPLTRQPTRRAPGKVFCFPGQLFLSACARILLGRELQGDERPACSLSSAWCGPAMDLTLNR